MQAFQFNDALLRQLFQSVGALGWLQIALVGLLILVLVFRPEKITSPGMFRMAGLMVALSILVPAFIDLVVTASAPLMTTNNRMGGSGSGRIAVMAMQIGHGLRPICLGLAVLFSLLSLEQKGRGAATHPQTPASFGGEPQRPKPFSE